MGRARAAHLGPELRRPLVLDAALPLFARDGFEAVSMQAIADAAGVSKPVLYSCYDSKEELFEELLGREERKFRHMVEESVPTLGALGSSEDLLRYGLAALLRAVVEAPDAFRVIYLQRNGENRVERGREHWEQRMGEVLSVWTQLPERETDVAGPHGGGLGRARLPHAARRAGSVGAGRIGGVPGRRRGARDADGGLGAQRRGDPARRPRHVPYRRRTSCAARRSRAGRP